jgi:AcrR family transcriptional regulator
MQSTSKISGEARRAEIIRTARDVFVEKGFHRTTTRELAEAAGVSEALLFKHFPSKEALYKAILVSCLQDEGSKIMERLRLLEPSTATLVSLVQRMVSRVVGGPAHEGERAFHRLILRSLTDEGDFTRHALQGVPLHWVQKIRECLEAARAAGDLTDAPMRLELSGWLVHQLVAGVVMHSLPGEAVIDYGVPREELVREIVLFCLRGMGLREEVIQHHCQLLPAALDEVPR